MILLFCIQLGLMPVNNFQMWDYNNYPQASEDLMEQYLSLDFEVYPFEFFYIGGNVQTDFFALKRKRYVPTKMSYLFKAGVIYGNFKIGFEHYCQHPVIPNSKSFQEGFIHFEGAYEKVYIEYKGKLQM